VEVDLDVDQGGVAAGRVELGVGPAEPPEELGHRDVDELQVPRVEDVLLGVGLVVPHAMAMNEAGGP
jgi:hypothetical protein